MADLETSSLKVSPAFWQMIDDRRTCPTIPLVDQVLNCQETILFEGCSSEALEAAFQEAIDRYMLEAELPVPVGS